MAVEVLMPKLGMTMEQGKLLEWTKKDKEKVQIDEIICIVETDKVTYEVTSPENGILVIIKDPEDNIPVGMLIGYIAKTEQEYATLKNGPKNVAKVQAKDVEQAESFKTPTVNSDNASAQLPPGKLRSSPAARALAKKHGIQLRSIVGTGPNGRITTKDIEQSTVAVSSDEINAATAPNVKNDATAGARKIAGEMKIDIGSIEGTGPNGQITRRDVIKALQKDHKPSTGLLTADFRGKRLLQEKPMSTIRQTIARRMMDSLGHSAQMTAFAEWDVSNVMNLRKLINANITGLESKVSFPGLMVFFLARVLKEMPIFNASVQGNSINYWEDVNIGVAVSVGDSLVVPVVHGADRLTLSQIQLKLSDLIERARNKKLMPDHMNNGTFTLSNVGSYGSQFETVILNPPEVALLGIGAIEKKPVVAGGDQIVIREMMPISLTFDHRIIDGATAGEFRNRMKTIVEHPEMIITCY